MDFERGRNCWRIARADRATVIVDADEYFDMARAAMLKARRRIMLVGWDFDARIRLDHRGPVPGAPAQVGEFIHWLVRRNPDLEVFLLRWDLGAVKTLFRGTTAFTMLKWMMHKRIHTRLDAYHPTGASHHQKIVVIDDMLAFCGGIDMTADRWDTREHRDDEPRRRRPTTRRRYKPWHDATTALEGPVAATIAEHARDRWHQAGGHRIDPVETDHRCWPQTLAPLFEGVDVAVARSAPEMPDSAGVREVEHLYLDAIASAKRSIYAESQYFASRRIAEAIARRLDEPDGPEIVIVNPESAQGWLEPIAMDTARARLVTALRQRDGHDRFRLYHPYTAGGQAIYVHAKVMVVDDRLLRVGSSNMNNRSMRLDTECDVAIAADAGDADNRGRIARVRDDLLAEHLGVGIDRVRETIASQGLIRAIDSLRSSGRTLRPYEVPDLSAVEAWLADNEVLDPEGPEEMFEALDKRGLFRGRLRLRGR